MRDRGADHDRVVLRCDAVELGEMLDVDQVPVAGKPQLHQEEQLGASAVDRDIVAVAVEELGDIVERACAMQVERGQRHERDALTWPTSDSAASVASRPSPILTGAPRSASVRPMAASPSAGYRDCAVGPMCPILTRLPAPCPAEIMTP